MLGLNTGAPVKFSYTSGKAPTAPGIDMKVTPDKLAPIIPNATKYHLEFLLAVKNES